MRKIIRTIVILIVLSIIAFFVFKIYLTPNERFKAVNVIPDKSVFVIEVDDPLNTWKKIESSLVWKNFKHNKLFNEINAQIATADSLINNNKFLFKLFGSRYLMTSVHQRNNNKFEALIVADLERYSKLSTAKKYILGLANENISITKRNYKDFEIYEVYQKKSHQTLYLSLHKNLAILSYDQHLIEESLDCILQPILGRNDQFVQIHNQIFGDGIIRIYLSYSQLLNAFKVSEIANNQEVIDFMNSVYFSGFKMDAFENQLSIDGFTNIKNKQVSYLNALSKSGSGGFNAQKIMPKTTRYSVRLGFDSFDKFLFEFENLLKQEGVYEDYLKNYSKLEKKLDIDIQENFVDWIDNEICFFSIEPRHSNLEDEFFIAIKAKNRQSAVKNLNFIKQQIDKKTPAKFTSIDYKSYEINYLQVTGLIKLLFKNVFLRMDKPYYTIIEDFVIFSNHPQALKDLINDYKSDETLKQWSTFQKFYKRNFGEKSNVFAFANVPFSVEAISNKSTGHLKSDLINNNNFFQSIPFVALNMLSHGELYKTKLVVFSDDSLYYKELSEVREKNKSYEVIEPISFKLKEELSLTDKPIVAESDPFKIEDLAILDLTAKEHLEYFNDSTIRLKVGVENGIKDGKYIEYYPNGEVKLKGKFENDIQVGTWKYYNSEGLLIEKKKF